jgi:hypothetical protein
VWSISVSLRYADLMAITPGSLLNGSIDGLRSVERLGATADRPCHIAHGSLGHSGNSGDQFEQHNRDQRLGLGPIILLYNAKWYAIDSAINRLLVECLNSVPRVILERTRAGLAAARSRGKRLGPPGEMASRHGRARA